MSHTVYSTSTSAFKVKDSDVFIQELHRLNVFSDPNESKIEAGYFYNANNGEFVISGAFDGEIGFFDTSNEEFVEQSISSLLEKHVEFTPELTEVKILTTYIEKRGGRIVNTGYYIDVVSEQDGEIQTVSHDCYTMN